MTDIASNPIRIQVEATQFRGPVSESLMQSVGGSINYLLDYLMPVGSVVPTMLSEAQFQSQTSANWVLAKGQAVPGSTYSTLVGPNVPDLRGAALRGKDHGAGRNPDGDTAVGTYQADAYASHTHTFSTSTTLSTYGGSRGAGNDGDDYSTSDVQLNNQITINSSGGSETRMKNVTVNFMIRIN